MSPRAKRPSELMMSDEYDALLESQGGLCVICLRPPASRRLSIDHDHRVKGELRIRGLMHWRCNQGLQMFQDDPERLRRAADYLEGKL